MIIIVNDTKKIVNSGDRKEVGRSRGARNVSLALPRDRPLRSAPEALVLEALQTTVLPVVPVTLMP